MVSEVVYTPYVETEYINPGTYAYDVFDDMIYHAVLLYNAALYTIRHETKINKKGDAVHLSWADVGINPTSVGKLALDRGLQLSFSSAYSGSTPQVWGNFNVSVRMRAFNVFNQEC